VGYVIIGVALDFIGQSYLTLGPKPKGQYLFPCFSKKTMRQSASSEPLTGFLALVVGKLWLKNNKLYN